MKAYEQVTRMVVPRRTYTIVRVDGRSFHSFLRHADRPFDDAVMAAMNAVAEALCADMSGAVFAFTQSDECSVLLTDFTGTGTEPWFGGVVQKMVCSTTRTCPRAAAHGASAATTAPAAPAPPAPAPAPPTPAAVRSPARPAWPAPRLRCRR
ncbi:tRNA(His) guanylyltransferase Thg1 family protein [Actinomadura sp. NPDC023710]|uniref:tRNA(His) guanylyltransferase Thg1 family protein n=1 Tax=Actinomadura sp. NPDC023710 TaxID=3158219 RepID=UPI0033DBD244